MKILPETGDFLQIPQHCFFPYNLICCFCFFPQFKANPPAVTFELTGETDDIFKIEREGLLYYTKTLDRETRSTHNLQVNWDQVKGSNSNLCEHPSFWKYRWHLPPLHRIQLQLSLH